MGTVRFSLWLLMFFLVLCGNCHHKLHAQNCWPIQMTHEFYLDEGVLALESEPGRRFALNEFVRLVVHDGQKELFEILKDWSERSQQISLSISAVEPSCKPELAVSGKPHFVTSAGDARLIFENVITLTGLPDDPILRMVIGTYQPKGLRLIFRFQRTTS